MNVLAKALSGLLLLAFIAVLGACDREVRAPAYQLPSGPSGGEVWRRARGRFDALRQRYLAETPYTMNMAVVLNRVGTGHTLRARGAVAVHPPYAMRMVLLGPGGTTALDLWICGETFRLSIPPAGIMRRGDADSSSEDLRGLPVGFLRWWFLRPLSGRLLSFAPPRQGEDWWRYVLRDQGAILDLSAKLHAEEQSSLPALRVRRVSDVGEELVTVDGSRCGRVTYLQRTTGVGLSVGCEKVIVQEPPERAFVDPDYGGPSCLAASRANDE